MIEQSSIIISLIFSRGKDTEIMISLLTKTTFLSEIIGALCATMIGQSPIIISLIFSRGKDTEIMQTSKKT